MARPVIHPRALLQRRDFLLGASALVAASCTHRNDGPAPPREPSGFHTVSFPEAPSLPGGQKAMLYVPEKASAPMLVALHGRGESGRGLDVGATAWPANYELDRLIQRLSAPPLTTADLKNMVSGERIAKLNASLAAHPFEGIGLACPYTPDLPDKSAKGSQGYGEFITQTLLPRLAADMGTKLERRRTGIDGVSMGGRLALLVGLTHPEVFGSVGCLQPAVREEEAAMFSELARAAMAKGEIKLRLVSSEEDYFLPAVRALSARMRADSVPHELLVIPGTHGYTFNRGPGGAEMLLFHERALRGLPSP